jgi:fructose-1,6-bisphosphatase/inositol monophosphatase family enzyme
MGWSTRVANATYLDVVSKLLDMGANVRRAGSGALALAYVADGRSDGYLELHMNSWDCLRACYSSAKLAATCAHFWKSAACGMAGRCWPQPPVLPKASARRRT